MGVYGSTLNISSSNTNFNRRKIHENNRNLERDNFSVNKLFDKNQNRLKNLETYEKDGFE